MAGTATVYTKAAGSFGLAAINLGTDSLKVILLSAAYAPSRDVDAVYADISANELATAGGYTAGGQALTGVTWAIDAANHRYKLTAVNPSWVAATFTARYMALYDVTAGNKLIAYYDFGAAQSPAGVTFTFTFDPTTGVLTDTCS
jgi:hypothetical protein